MCCSSGLLVTVCEVVLAAAGMCADLQAADVAAVNALGGVIECVPATTTH
jgi:hypothetical protein